jgi:prolyl-tRNA synthetase
MRSMADIHTFGDSRNMFFIGGWCGDEDKEAELKQELGLTVRCMPLEALSAEPVCFMTGRPALHQVVVAKAY